MRLIFYKDFVKFKQKNLCLGLITNMKPNAVSFKSRINILTPKVFSKVPNGKYIYFFDDGKTKECVVKAKRFYTTGIKTCTGGGVKNDVDAVGFHLWDRLGPKSLKNKLNKIKNLIPEITGGFLIGSKRLRGAPNSVPNFEYILSTFLKKSPNISYFKTFKDPAGQASIKYSHMNDTWDICITSGSRKEISTIDKLKKFFAEIHIAESDELYVDGYKVNIKDAADLFC